MGNALYETFANTSSLGISYAWYTNSGGHHPLHWHEEVELLYPLSGEADIIIDGNSYKLLKRHLLVVESSMVHSTHSYNTSSMFLCIHISKSKLREYIPDIEALQLHCKPNTITDDNFKYYLEICRLLDDLTRLYVNEPPTFSLEADGIILQATAKLYAHFSIREKQPYATDNLSIERIRKIIAFVEEHFQEPITLSDAANMLGIGKEYFCRFFKNSMGMSFLQYLNEIRVSHIYYDLLYTDLTIAELMEKNGFFNQKLFNRCFKEIYGCTPSEVRKNIHQSSMQ